MAKERLTKKQMCTIKMLNTLLVAVVSIAISFSHRLKKKKEEEWEQGYKWFSIKAQSFSLLCILHSQRQREETSEAERERESLKERPFSWNFLSSVFFSFFLNYFLNTKFKTLQSGWGRKPGFFYFSFYIYFLLKLNLVCWFFPFEILYAGVLCRSSQTQMGDFLERER